MGSLISPTRPETHDDEQHPEEEPAAKKRRVDPANKDSGISVRGVADSASGGKFWEVSVDGCEMTTRWGKLGSGGASKTKVYASSAQAVKEAQKLVQSKEKGGYVMRESGDGESGGDADAAGGGGPRLFLKEEQLNDGYFNGEVMSSRHTREVLRIHVLCANQEWDEGILECGGQTIPAYSNIEGDSAAVELTRSFEVSEQLLLMLYALYYYY